MNQYFWSDNELTLLIRLVFTTIFLKQSSHNEQDGPVLHTISSLPSTRVTQCDVVSNNQEAIWNLYDISQLKPNLLNYFFPNIQWEVGGCHFTSCLSTGQRIFPYHHDFLTGGVCTTGMHYMRDVTIFTRNNRPYHHGPIQGLDGNDIPYPQSSPFCPFFFFQIRTLFSIFIIYPLPSFSPTFSNFLSSSLFVKIFSIF